MTAEQLLTADLPTVGRPRSEASGTVQIIRSSFALVEPHAEALGRHFYATLFSRAPETRDLFPVNMEVQRSRLLRALVHVVQMVDQTDDLVPFLQQLGRDHRKFGVIAQHYDAVGAALLSTIATFSGPAWTPEVEKAWTDAYDVVAGAMREAAGAERGPASWLGRVVGHQRLGWDLAKITVQASEPIPYRAGQYVSVETPQRPRLWRYLSPACAPRRDGVLEFHVRAVQGGWVSRAIVAHSRVGDTWRIGPPMGRMSLDPTRAASCSWWRAAPAWRRSRRCWSTSPPRIAVPAPRCSSAAAPGRTSTTSRRCASCPTATRGSTSSPSSRPTKPRAAPSRARSPTSSPATAPGPTTTCWSAVAVDDPAHVSRMLVAGTPLDRIRYDPFTMD
jgi:hemoglobin-like flavoprotein